MNQLTKGEDYYLLDDGRLVFTASYHLKRGFCCGKGCLNCPYDYTNVQEPKRSVLLSERNKINHDGGR